jgi:hypothetical protein
MAEGVVIFFIPINGMGMSFQNGKDGFLPFLVTLSQEMV